MRKWTKTVGLLFWAAASVYSGRAIAVEPAGVERGAPPTSGVRLLDDAADPFASTTLAPAATTRPSVLKSESEDDETAALPGGREGRSVSSSEVNVSDAGTVEIHVNDASLVEVLRMLSLQSQRNIVASKEVRGTVTANLYNVTVREALDAILHANGYAYREKGNFIYVYTVKELEAAEKADRHANTEVFRLYYTPVANAATMIKPVLSPDAQVSFSTPALSGIETGTKDTGGNSHAIEDVMVVTDYPENLEAVHKILKEIDRRPQQILIEATILRAALNEDNALGVDFNLVGGVDFTSITHANGQITGANLPPTNPNVPVPNSNVVSSVGTGNSFSSSIPNAFKVGIASNNMSVFLSALEGVTDTTVIANPKVLALNKQKGEVIVGRKDGYITTTVTETSQTQTVEFLDTGTRLIFRPFIADDGYIRMEIHPEDSSGGLTANNPPLPFKITTEVTSNVMIKDGHTIVIGGLFREESTASKSQVPFLGNLPLAGPLFRQQRDTTSREEIIILLTPHIVKDDDQFSESSREMMKEWDKQRTGVRKEMMPWGRERMAEGCYDKAVEEMNKPEPDRKRALWFLDCATGLNPKFTEAIDLKEKVTQRELHSVDNSVTRDFIRQQIMADLPPATQPASPAKPAPTTAPVAAARPATQPAIQPVVEAPVATMQPVADAAPATRPSVDADKVIADATAATQPATPPVGQTTVSVVEMKQNAEAAGPTTAPATTQETTVTELPMDPAVPQTHETFGK